MNTNPFASPDEATAPPSVTFGDASRSVTETAEQVPFEAAPAETPEAEATPEPAPENVGAKIAKRAPSDLESDVLAVTQSYANGTVKLPEGKQLTPHAIAKLVEANRGDDNPVSAGAVSDALKRWEALGFIRLTEKPVSFSAFAVDSSRATLNDLKEARRERLARERAAARDAKKAAKAAEVPAEEAVAEEAPAEVNAEGTQEPSGF